MVKNIHTLLTKRLTIGERQNSYLLQQEKGKLKDCMPVWRKKCNFFLLSLHLLLSLLTAPPFITQDAVSGCKEDHLLLIPYIIPANSTKKEAQLQTWPDVSFFMSRNLIH